MWQEKQWLSGPRGLPSSPHVGLIAAASADALEAICVNSSYAGFVFGNWPLEASCPGLLRPAGKEVMRKGVAQW